MFRPRFHGPLASWTKLPSWTRLHLAAGISFAYPNCGGLPGEPAPRQGAQLLTCRKLTPCFAWTEQNAEVKMYAAVKSQVGMRGGSSKCVSYSCYAERSCFCQ